MADQHLRGIVHDSDVQRQRHVPDPPCIERRARPAVQDAIQIGTFHGGNPGVEIVRNRHCLRHDDLFLAHVGIQRFADRMGVRVLFDIDMRNLCNRMNARIRPPGTVYARLLAAKPEHGLFHRLLDRRAVVLALPAGVTAAVIFDGQFPAGHERTAPTAAGLPRA